jgi:hypothetical protein
MGISDAEGYRIRADDLREKAAALRRMLREFDADAQPELAALAVNYVAMASTFDALARHVEAHERHRGRR